MRLIRELSCSADLVRPADPSGGGWWRRFAVHPAAAIIVLLAAFWPVWVWYARRIVDGSDEPLGLGALAVAGWLVWTRCRGTGWNPQTNHTLSLNARISNAPKGCCLPGGSKQGQRFGSGHGEGRHSQ